MLKLFLFILTGSLLFLSSSIFAQEEMSPDQKAWMEYMTPGEMHKIMAKSVGDWKTVSTFWTDPEAEPMVNKGNSKTEMIMGGRYLKSSHHSMVMGMPMEGMYLQSYDNASKEFIAMWIDNLGTGMSIARGSYDVDSKTLNFVGSMVDPMTGDELTYRQTVRLIDDDHQTFEMFMTHDGEEYLSMLIEFSK